MRRCTGVVLLSLFWPQRLGRVSADRLARRWPRQDENTTALSARVLRKLGAYGSSTLILALFFAELGHSDAKIGLFMTLTLVGDVLISLALTFVADSLGRRNILILGSLLMTLS